MTYVLSRADGPATSPPPAPSRLGRVCARFVGVRSVKFCALTAHTTVTEKYDGGAALTA